ncbi:MAG: SsrA-binding protein [Candidatus Marinimicrobia bacterium]|nr:SsrA-binding protein [Candidatus Neomarinimicrobiota bacterium]|tara:strand:+ start:16046 stop:16495 length:450 start_codon:yes stop_codon:yes gene_type:complete
MKSKIVATNKKAYHDYFIIDTCEAGIVLRGSEVKSIREGNINLKDSYITIHKFVVKMNGVHISRYSHSGYTDHDPYRERRLLLSKKETTQLSRKVAEKGFTLIPVKLYFKGSWAKVEIALAKGKKTYDKRESIKKKDLKRDIERELRRR